MIVYNLALFVHLLGLIAFFGAFILLQNAGRRLRAATTWQEARPWLDLLRQVSGMLIGGLLMMGASGIYMTHKLWSFSAPWVICGIAAAVLLMIAHPLTAGRRLGELRRMAAENHGVVGADERALLAGPSLWAPVFAMNGAALGVVWIMASKPGLMGSILFPLVLAGLGALIGTRLRVSRPAERRQGSVERSFAPPPMARRRSAS